MESSDDGRSPVANRTVSPGYYMMMMTMMMMIIMTVMMVMISKITIIYSGTA